MTLGSYKIFNCINIDQFFRDLLDSFTSVKTKKETQRERHRRTLYLKLNRDTSHSCAIREIYPWFFSLFDNIRIFTLKKTTIISMINLKITLWCPIYCIDGFPSLYTQEVLSPKTGGEIYTFSAYSGRSVTWK